MLRERGTTPPVLPAPIVLPVAPAAPTTQPAQVKRAAALASEATRRSHPGSVVQAQTAVKPIIVSSRAVLRTGAFARQQLQPAAMTAIVRPTVAR